MVLWILSNRLALPVLLCVVRPLPQNTGDYNPIVLESHARFESDLFCEHFQKYHNSCKDLDPALFSIF